MKSWQLIFILLVSVSLCVSQSHGDEPTFSIAIHGGAGSKPHLMDAETKATYESAMKDALTQGKAILESGGTALDAVEKVIVLLEDNPLFNAGQGAVFNADGKHELDASIMNGSDLSCGAVAGVKTVKNPIGLARKVMTETRHVLLATDGAEAFADQLGSDKIPRVENSYFTTPKRKMQLERRRTKRKASQASPPSSTNPAYVCFDDPLIGTVGCVALDKHGNLAAGTSTGGMSNKRFGRVGDSPVVGAGTYADNKTCAVSGTGIGEEYIRKSVAYNVAAQMQYANATLENAVKDNLENRLNPNDGGLIAVDKDGNIAVGTNTAGMLHGIADGKGQFKVAW